MENVKIRGFGKAKKAEINSILETGKAIVRRKLYLNEDGSTPSVDNCPFGTVGKSMWWMESLKQKRAESRIHSKITSVTTEVDAKGVPVWVISHERISL